MKLFGKNECLRLRVKDIDFGMNHIVLHDTKGRKDRVTILQLIHAHP